MKNYNLKGNLFFLLLLLTTQVWSQSRTITGTITDASNKQTLPGVSVVEKGTTLGTTTDADGKYSLKLDSNQHPTLVFSFIGYDKKEVKVSSDKIINVQLSVNKKMMNEVMVVAYGETTRNELTSSVTKVDAKKLENIPIVSVDQILQGQVAGLQVSSYSGQPGGEVSVKLRGVGSITAGSQPLYVVDGIPINTGALGTGLTWTSNSLAGINANDIENVTVLKDASATAIYGSRGANGVIVITTKKGKAGKTQIHFDANYGQNNIILNEKARPLNADEYLELTHEGLINAGYTEANAQKQLKSFGAYNGVNTDWLREVTRTSAQQSYNLSFNGGNETTQFYLSGGYFDQVGTTIGSGFKRVSGSLSLNQKATERLNLQTNIVLSSSKQKTPFQSGYFRSPIISAYFLNPWQNPYDSAGNFNTDPNEFTDIYNPLAINSMDENYFNNLKVIASVGADYRIIEGLKFTTKISVDYNNTDEFLYANPFYGDGESTEGWAQQSNTNLKNWVWTNFLDYHKDFTKSNLSFNIKGGYESQLSKQQSLTAYGEGFPPTTSIQVLSAAANPRYISSSGSDYSFASLFSNGSLTYNQKYTISGSFRRDGSSRFGSSKRYGNFYSVGASWSLDHEEFIKNIDWLSTLRMRTSYGSIGNGDIGNYTWRPLYNYGSNYNGDLGSNPSNPGNYNLTWERNNPFNIGIDAGFFKDRLNVVIDFYTRKTTDLLLNVPVSQTTGFSSTLQNIGEMTNKGLEFTVNATAVQTKDINWHIDFNIATNHNEISKLYKHQDVLSLPYIYREGEAYHSFYTRLYAGVNPQTGQAMWYTDSSQSETTTDLSKVKRKIVGSSEPKFFGGLTNTVGYKGFSLSFQINFVFVCKVYDGWGFYTQSDGAYIQYNQTLVAMDRWQHPGDITDVPKYQAGNSTSSNYGSTRYIYDGDYVRLRDITFAYDLSPKVLSKMKMSSVKFYIKGTNMYTWVKDKRISFDPDLANGISDLNLPNIKTLVGGISIGF